MQVPEQKQEQIQGQGVKKDSSYTNFLLDVLAVLGSGVRRVVLDAENVRYASYFCRHEIISSLIVNLDSLFSSIAFCSLESILFREFYFFVDGFIILFPCSTSVL